MFIYPQYVCKVNLTSIIPSNTLNTCMKEIMVNNILELRRTSGITQETLAHAVGVTRQTIIAIERGNYSPSILLALKISHFFKKPVENIFTLKHL